MTHLRLLLVAAVWMAGARMPRAGETFSFGDKDDWTNPNLLVNADDSLGLAGGQLTCSSQTFPVDTSATSKLGGHFRRLAGASEKDRFFFAFLNFDKDMQRIEAVHVNAVKGFDTELASPCAANDTVVNLRNGEAFTAGAFIAFKTRPDFHDLPNRNVNRKAPIMASRRLGDGTWQVTVKEPVGIDAPAGTGVRAHHGGWYQYSGALAAPIPREWTAFETTIRGTAPGDHRDKWRPGTAYAQLIIFGSGPAKGPLLAFRDVRFETAGGDGPGPASPRQTAVTIPKGTAETDLSLKPVKGGLDLSVRFENGSSRRIRITVFDEKPKQQERDGTPPSAGIEIQPFDVRYTMCSAAPDVMRKLFTLSVRQLDDAAEFRVNGSYIGTFKRASRAASITSTVKPDNVSFRPGRSPGWFVPLDIATKHAPGAMEGARIGLADKRIPFLAADGKNLDMGLTARQLTLGGAQASLAETPASFVFTVPCAQYSHVWVLCALEDDPRKDPVLNARLTRYVGGPGYLGRAFEGMANTAVRLPDGATRVGEVAIAGKALPLWRVEIPMQTGNIQDLVFTENRGTHARMRFGKYLDFELSGRLIKRRGPAGDRRASPDPAHVSSVHVFGVTLEKPAAEMEVKTVQAGNIFHNREVPEVRVQIRPQRPGDYRLRWTIRNAEDAVVGSGERNAEAKAGREFAIPLAQRDLGWYGIDFALLDGDRLLLTHNASFALLGEDTRKAAVADSPYGTWNYGGAHYTAPDVETYGPVLLKAGFRRSAGVDRYSEQELAPWKLATPQVRTGSLDATDEELLQNIRKSLARYPSLTNVMIFHENAEWPYQVAPELIGQRPDPRSEWKDADKRWNHAVRLGRILRQHFPQLRITLGNSLACTELVAEGLRRKFPEAYADYLGLEVVGRTSLPERQWEGALQGGELMLQTARLSGYHRWKLNACYESNYRLNAILGDATQAEWYVRDLLLSQAWGFRDIFIGVIMDTGNGYAGSFWGASGLCTRSPFLYPKKSYVGVAVATKMLDQVALSRNIPTGSKTVYALEFRRKDGRYVCALWTSRGTADLAIETGSADYALFDFYGRPMRRPAPGTTLRLTAGTAAQYILAGADPVNSIACGQRAYPADREPDDVNVANRMDDLAEWALSGTKEPLLEKTRGVAMPYRTRGQYAVRQAVDSQRGRCLELELVEPDRSLPLVFSEYALLMLKRPQPLKGKPNSLGMWVKGNSGWGQVYWVIEDARRRRRISCGTRVHRADVFDYDGRLSISYDGWNFLSVPITDRSSIPDLSTGSAENLWEFGEVGEDQTIRRGATAIEYPIKLLGVAFAAQSRPLFLTAREEHKQIIRFKDISVFDD